MSIWSLCYKRAAKFVTVFFTLYQNHTTCEMYGKPARWKMLKANFLYYGMVIGINQTATDRMRILQLAYITYRRKTSWQQLLCCKYQHKYQYLGFKHQYRYGILEFNAPFDTVQVISETDQTPVSAPVSKVSEWVSSCLTAHQHI